MFAKLVKYFRTQNEIMEKLLVKLSDTNNWVRYDITYKLKNSDLEIGWGTAYGYESVTEVREIRNPRHMRIPVRYRRKVQLLINKIMIREGCRTTGLDFLNQYLSGEYCYSLSIEKESLSERTIWLMEEGIVEYDIVDEKIWFKNESDAMAFKLKWAK